MTEPAFRQMTEEEYLRTEEFSPAKREFVAGYVCPLHGKTLAQAGATSGHGELALATAANLRPFARKQGCRIYQADMRVNTQTPTGKAVHYSPDGVATREPMGGRATSVNAPCFTAEVLSPGTRHTDQTDKLWADTSLASLQIYLTVEPERRHVRVIGRQAEGWSEG